MRAFRPRCHNSICLDGVPRTESCRTAWLPSLNQMARVKTDVLEEGMVVAGDVKNVEGMLLVPAGCQLTERQINVFRAWGVEEIEIEGSQPAHDSDPLANLPPETVTELSAEIRNRFWEADDTNPVFAEVFKLMLHRRARTVSCKS